MQALQKRSRFAQHLGFIAYKDVVIRVAQLNDSDTSRSALQMFFLRRP
jgi:hypothetical protein